MQRKTDQLDARAFGLAAGAVAAVLVIACSLAVAVAPDATTAFAGYVIHVDLTGFSRTLTWSSFLGGLLFWTIGTAVVFAAAGALYNRFARRMIIPA